MTRGWANEFRRLVLLVVCCAAVGSAVGQVELFLVLALITYIVWNLYNLYKLDKWLKSGQLYQHPESTGIWEEIFISVYRAISRQRKRRKDLLGIIARFREATSALPDTVIVTDNLGNIEWCNRSASRSLGLSNNKHAGQRLTNFFRHPSFVEYLMAGNFDKDLEVPSPRDHNILLQVRVINYGAGRRMIVVRDITRLHRLEVMRSDFVANVSHELRTPLTVLQGYLETMREDCADDQRVPFEQMQNQASRMHNIVNDLMKLTALESGAAPENIELIDMRALTHQVRSDTLFLASNKKQKLRVEIDSDAQIWGSWDELYSALTNLVTNAIKYSPENGIIRVVWSVENNVPKLSVIDNGDGIAARHIPRLTERFYRIDVGRSRASGGTGLGLAIVKHILVRHNARLEVESELGKGSRFSCVFPNDTMYQQVRPQAQAS